MQKSKLFVLTFIILSVLITGGISAQEQGFGGESPSEQEPVGEEELDMFVSALNEIYPVQDKFQLRLEQVFKDSPLSEERFNEINRLKSISPEEFDSIPEEETIEYNKILNTIEKLNQEFQKEMTMIIRDEGLSVEEFQVIANYVNENPEVLQERMN